MKKLILILALVLGSVWIMPQTAEARPNKGYHYSQKKKVKKHRVKKVRIVRQQPVAVAPKPVIAEQSDEESHAAYFAREQQRNIVNEQTKRAVSNAFVHPEKRHYSSKDLVSKASNYVGANAAQLGLPPRLWCADFVNMMVGGTDRRAISFVNRGMPAYHGCVNCVAVTKRRGGHHVGIVKGYDESGNPIIISGNHNRRVGIGVYARNRVVAYRYV